MSQIIAVAGGSGQLGRTIVDAIRADGKFQVVALGRKSSDATEDRARTIGVDYTDVDALVKTLQDEGVHTVISTINANGDIQAELNLIQAAERSGSTKRYIPATWGIDVTEEVAAYFPIGRGKRTVLATLAETSLEWTTVINGFFADFFVAPRVESYLNPLAVFLDPEHDAAVIPGSGDVPVVLTQTTDIAKYVSALLSTDTWEKTSYIVGSKVTWNEMIAIFEEAKGTKFDVKRDSLETMRAGKITELPSHPHVYPFFPKEHLQPFLAAFGVMFDTGVFDFEPTLNRQFPEISPRSIKELAEEAYKKK